MPKKDVRSCLRGSVDGFSINDALEVKKIEETSGLRRLICSAIILELEIRIKSIQQNGTFYLSLFLDFG